MSLLTIYYTNVSTITCTMGTKTTTETIRTEARVTHNKPVYTLRYTRDEVEYTVYVVRGKVESNLYGTGDPSFFFFRTSDPAQRSISEMERFRCGLSDPERCMHPKTHSRYLMTPVGAELDLTLPYPRTDPNNPDEYIAVEDAWLQTPLAKESFGVMTPGTSDEVDPSSSFVFGEPVTLLP